MNEKPKMNITQEIAQQLYNDYIERIVEANEGTSDMEASQLLHHTLGRFVEMKSNGTLCVVKIGALLKDLNLTPGLRKSFVDFANAYTTIHREIFETGKPIEPIKGYYSRLGNSLKILASEDTVNRISKILRNIDKVCTLTKYPAYWELQLDCKRFTFSEGRLADYLGEIHEKLGYIVEFVDATEEDQS